MRATFRAVIRLRWLLLAMVLAAVCVVALDLETVQSPAMMPGIEPGDLVLVDRLGAELTAPDRGDIVLVRNPDDRERELMVRVVALEDDAVELRADGTVLIDGKPMLREPFAWKAPRPAEDELAHALAAGPRAVVARLPDGSDHRVLVRGDSLSQGARSTALTVPRGHLWVLGDHRDAAYDSRAFGPVPRGDVVGRVRLVVRTARDDGGLIGRWLRLP